jgi:hypothetical protein
LQKPFRGTLSGSKSKALGMKGESGFCEVFGGFGIVATPPGNRQFIPDKQMKF